MQTCRQTQTTEEQHEKRKQIEEIAPACCVAFYYTHHVYTARYVILAK